MKSILSSINKFYEKFLELDQTERKREEKKGKKKIKTSHPEKSIQYLKQNSRCFFSLFFFFYLRNTEANLLLPFNCTSWTTIINSMKHKPRQTDRQLRAKVLLFITTPQTHSKIN